MSKNSSTTHSNTNDAQAMADTKARFGSRTRVASTRHTSRSTERTGPEGSDSRLKSKSVAASSSSSSSRMRPKIERKPPLALDDGAASAGGEPARNEEVKKIYEHFHALGMPEEITMDVLTRLCAQSAELLTTGNGGMNLKDMLTFLSKRLVGRQEARRGREIITRAREEHAASKSNARPASKIKAPSTTNRKTALEEDLLDDPMKMATARRESAYRGLDVVRREYEGVQKDMHVLDLQKRDIQRKLEEKRRMLLLMTVLERRETVRLARFGVNGGIGSLLSDLRKEADIATKDFERAVSNSGPVKVHSIPSSRVSLEKRKEGVWKYRNTTEALAHLHALHIRRKRQELDEDPPDSNSASVFTRRQDAEKRLDKVLSRLGLVGRNDRGGAEKMKDKLLGVASRRAGRARGPKLPPGKSGETEELKLEDMHRRIDEKKSQIQEKLNRAVALGWFCEEHIDLITTFRAETVTALSEMLEVERKRVDGYVDAQLAGVKLQAQAPASPQTGFEREVGEVVGSGRLAVWEDVKALVERVALSERVVRCNPINKSKEEEDTAGYEELVKVKADCDASADRNRKVLERKGKKADYGFEIAKEISDLLGDCRKLR